MGLTNKSMLELIEKSIKEFKSGLISDVECMKYIKKFWRNKHDGSKKSK